MTIDEVIEKEIYYTNTEDDDRYHKQLAEWLEDYRLSLKMRELNAKYLPKIEEAVHKLELLKEYEKGYNKAIDDFYNSLADDLIWIKERFGDDVYTDLWCDVGTRAEQLKAGGDNERM